VSKNIESILQEDRRFSPSDEFRKKAKISSPEEYQKLYEQSISDPDGFWSDVANELHWFKTWDKTVEWNEPFVKWFVGGKTNPAYNALDYQIEQGRGDKIAFLFP